jgi:hypothetical protein
MAKERLKLWKHIFEICEAVATISAIIIGGIWTYKNFIAERVNHPRLQMTVTASDLALPADRKLLIIDENLENLGNRLITLRAGEIRIIQVLPVPKIIAADLKASTPIPATTDPMAWPVLNDLAHHYDPKQQWTDEHIIEPGEKDQIHTEVVLDKGIQVVGILAYIYNPTGNPNKPLGWQVMNFYNLRTHSLYSDKTEPHKKGAK